MKDNNKSIDMVENGTSKPINMVITIRNLLQECKRLGMMSFFINKNDEDKIEYIIGRAEYAIIEWHEEFLESRRKCALMYEKWLKSAKEVFGKKEISLGEIYRLNQDENEGIVAFIERVKEKACIYKLSDLEIVDIIAEGLNAGNSDIKK
ncbi:uncharacterized protein VNE69_10049 [Vairimorpha necatrix]|uniref:Uncharacterized protein n=1 Tax=Vairimorpha necatrix TaxID=6039 RepID=A0AAX4JFB7_9MICR